MPLRCRPSLSFCLLIVLGSLFAAGTVNAAKPKNVLFLYVEDLGYYTGERGVREPHSRIAGLSTPNLDRLARRSLVFNRAFCGQSVCSPSKAVIYTGKMPHANGIWRNVHNAHPKLGKPDRWIPLPQPLTKRNDPSNLAVTGIHEDLPTLVQRLKSQGVYCALSGKLHVQPARHFPYDTFVGTEALETVIERAGDRPWFFWSNPDQTHAPFWKSVRQKLTDPKNRNSAPRDVDPNAIGPLPWLPDTPAARIDIAQYYSNVRVIDAMVGRLLKKLEDSGQADETLVVFTGDHGIPVQRGKTSIYPAGTHVPCFISGPGVTTGRVLDTPISQVDFHATFLETFGLQPPGDDHGRSLWPILSGKVDRFADRTTILTETNNSFMSSPGRGDTTMARAVCDGRFYYIRNIIQQTVRQPEEKVVFVGSGYGEYGDPKGLYAIDLHDETVRQRDRQPLPYELLRQLCMSDAPPEELYDLNADPWATRNLIDDPAHAETLREMRAEMQVWRQRTGDRDIHPKRIPRRTESTGK